MIADERIEPIKLLQNLDQIEWLVTIFVKRATTLLDVSRMTSYKPSVCEVEVDVVEVARSVSENFQPVITTFNDCEGIAVMMRAQVCSVLSPLPSAPSARPRLIPIDRGRLSFYFN